MLLAIEGACGQSLSVEQGEQWFARNKAALQSLNNLLLNAPLIRRVEPELPNDIIPQYGTFDSNTMSAYENIKTICGEIGVKNIAIARRGSEPNGELIGIRYILRSYGILVSGGGFLSIQYTPKDSFVKYLYDTENTVRPLEIDGWYVVVYEDKS